MNALCELLTLQATHIVSFSCMQAAHTAGVSLCSLFSEQAAARSAAASKLVYILKLRGLKCPPAARPPSARPRSVLGTVDLDFFSSDFGVLGVKLLRNSRQIPEILLRCHLRVENDFRKFTSVLKNAAERLALLPPSTR